MEAAFAGRPTITGIRLCPLYGWAVAMYIVARSVTKLCYVSGAAPEDSPAARLCMLAVRNDNVAVDEDV